MDINLMRDKLEQLEALRGAHDQTMRCEAIRIAYGNTERFLEAEINRVKQAIDFALVEAIDCD